MPPKQNTHARTWGSRYDTLPISPPVSPEIRKDEIRTPVQDADESSSGQNKRKDDKLPHDASIFVGSLPSNVNHTELTRLLTEHLSGYTEIQSIKVIRDSKGGVCAFVQCEDAASASSFLENLQSSPPKPLLGRILRYEPARAFRTLLLSYRAPSQVVTPAGICNFPPGTVAGQVFELELPRAMRLWKPKNGKYHRVIYNAEAIEADRYTRAQCTDDVVSGKEEVVYLQPLKFDEESIVRIAKYFGPLEKVAKLGESHELVQPATDSGPRPECYPSPHNAPRSNCMDTSCWEVKWVHRDDCVTALMALRRIPHFSVSWAHQPQSIVVEQCSSFRRHQRTPNYISRVQSSDRFQPYTSFAPPLVLASNLPSDPSSGQTFPPGSMFENDDRAIPKRGSVFSIESSKSWANPATPPSRNNLQTSTSDVSSEASPDGTSNGFVTTRINWAEADSPPLVEPEFDTEINWNAWGGPHHFEAGSRQLPIVTSHSASEIVAPRRIQVPSPLIQDDDEVPTPGLAMSPTTPRTTLLRTPVTPTTTYGVRLPACDTGDIDQDRGDHASPAAREFDPTTLFVGGLEMYGPMAWTDEKLRALFDRFEGLEHVRLVRPANGNTAFAFIKYNNAESPVQAILEEHNRMYAGRALKVQLRDVNPPRSPWKQNRGRGRFVHPPRKVIPTQRAGGESMHRQTIAAPVQSGLGTVGARKSPSAEDSSMAEAMNNARSKAMDQERSEDTIAHTSENVQTEKYREWYDAPLVVPPHESGTSSTPPAAPPPATAALPYPVPGYYPMPWMHPYPQPGHYQVPCYPPYPGYPVSTAPMQAYATTPPGSETNGPVVGNNTPWPGAMCNAYTPYFGPLARPGVDQQGQAPLVPSGFIQNDQGTLIAVYPPDALDQYMASQGANNNGGGNPPISAQPGSAGSTWSSVQALPGSVSSYSVGSQTASNPPKLYHIQTNPLWGTMAPPVVPIPSINHPAPAYSANAASRGDENLGTTSPSPALARRQGSRRDVHNHSSNRSFRAFNGRNGRGHMHHHGFVGNSEIGTGLHYRNSKATNTPDWNQWNARR